MNGTNVQIDRDLNLDGCREFQRQLARAGIVSTVYQIIDNKMVPIIQSDAESEACDIGSECQTEMIGDYSDIYTNVSSCKSLCPHGHIRLAIPVRYRRQITGVVVCCLKHFQYEKTEVLERLCSRLELDSDVIARQGLTDAVSGDQFEQLLKILLPHLLEKTQQNLDQRYEIEAMTESLSQSYEEISLLHRINDGMKLTRNPGQFFEELCDDICSVVDADKILMFWCENSILMTDPEIVTSAGGIQLDQVHLEMIWQRTQFEAETSSGILVDSNVDHPYNHQWPEMIRNIVCVPIKRDQKSMGALVALNKHHKADFDSIDTKLLISVANELAVYLENFRLYGDLQDLLIGSLRALTSSIDAKDPYTCGHSERVAIISLWLAKKLELGADQEQEIYLAGLLHDVGKIGVSELVLRKPGRLTEEEFDQIHQHPQIGSNILSGIKQMTDVSRAVLTHHERYDGKGYPMGLRGEEIPLAGRIVKVADSFDAMISDRVYRKALPITSALAEIRHFSGTQFDPRLAEIFLQSDINDLLEQLNQIDRSSICTFDKPVAMFH